jgi:TolB-like protein/Flp pilus assembly protein TadD
MEKQAPGISAVEAAVERITASRTFARAGRAANLLRYVVERTAAGRQADIKEYTIAVELFRREDYNPKVDSTVRVEAGRLRELLAKYYETEGRDDPVRVEIPKGSYAPVFHQIPAPSPAPSNRARVFRVGVASAVLAAALAAVVVWRWGTSTAPVAHPTSRPLTIAVLPFADLSRSEDPHLCDRLTEELILGMTEIEGLRVAARSSVMPYKGREKDVRSIGRELQVQAVLEGTVNRENDRIRVTAQFIDADDGLHLWSETFESDAGSNLERELSGRIVRSFRTNLGGTRRALVQARSRNREASHYYLRGAYHYGAAQLSKAAEHFRAASAADSGYAPAWAGLANTLVFMADWREAKPMDTLPVAVQAARRAVALDASLADAQQAMGRVHVYFEHDWAGAEKAFRRAIELDPAYTEARIDYARLVLVPRGRFDEAVGQYQRAAAIEPGTNRNVIQNSLANAYIKARKYDNAGPYIQTSLRLAPQAPSIFVMQGLAAIGKGDLAAALGHFQRSNSLRPSSWALGHIGHTLARLGRVEEAQQVIGELQAMSAKVSPEYELALIHAALGDKDRAFAALDRACADLSPALLWVRVDFLLDGLHGDPRFASLLKRMRLE